MIHLLLCSCWNKYCNLVLRHEIRIILKLLVIFFFADAVLSPVSGHTIPTQGDALFSDLRLVSLEKQLNIELKVRVQKVVALVWCSRV